MGTQLYRIICLKRSKFTNSDQHEYLCDWWESSEIVYWLPARGGYTTRFIEAGIYSADELDKCNGVHLDWFAMRVEREA